MGRRYQLTEYVSKSGEPCSCPELIPGLDASICPVCQIAWKMPRQPDRPPPPALEQTFTGSLSDYVQLRKFTPKSNAPQKMSEKLDVPVTYMPEYFSYVQSQELFNLSNELAWKRNVASMYGKKIEMPRDEIMFGPVGYTYRYNNVFLEALPWPAFMNYMKAQVEKVSGHQFAIAIGNRYHNGQDSIGWHADDSPEIGERPAIASISLGDTRRFKLRHNKTKKVFDYELSSGALLVMHPGCQEKWQHCVPKTKTHVGTRINWTFRPYVEAIA